MDAIDIKIAQHRFIDDYHGLFGTPWACLTPGQRRSMEVEYIRHAFAAASAKKA